MGNLLIVLGIMVVGLMFLTFLSSRLKCRNNHKLYDRKDIKSFVIVIVAVLTILLPQIRINGEERIFNTIDINEFENMNNCKIVSGKVGKSISIDKGQWLQQKIYYNMGFVDSVDADNVTIVGASGLEAYSSENNPRRFIIVINGKRSSFGYIGKVKKNEDGSYTLMVTSARVGGMPGWVHQIMPSNVESYEIRKSYFQITGALSIGAWVRFHGHKPYTRTIIAKAFVKEPFEVTSYVLALTSADTLSFAVSSNGRWRDIHTHNKAFSQGEWHWVAGVFDPGKRWEIYIDGKCVVSQKKGVPEKLYDSIYPVCIGRLYKYKGESFLYGDIDEPFIVDRALTAEEIQKIYKGGKL